MTTNWIKNVILPTGKVGSVGYVAGKITEILFGENGLPDGAFVVHDGFGRCLLIPGGIDGHVHFRQPGGEAKEDWLHGARAALLGGTTTVGDMPNSPEPTISIKALERKIALIGKQLISYGLWFGATKDNIDLIPLLVQYLQVFGIKIFMGSSTGDLLVPDDETIELIMRSAVKSNQLVAIHAEDEYLIRENRLTVVLVRPIECSDHCVIRNPYVEINAVRRALALQKKTGCRLLFLHLSTIGALDLVARAKDEGRPVYAEACTHHLFLWLNSSLPANFAKVNPPLREYSSVLAMRKVLTTGIIDVVSSDHAAHRLTPEEKLGSDYDTVPSGVPGVQTRMNLMIAEYLSPMVQPHNINLQQLVELTSTNAARILGLSNKGEIAVGKDADMLLVDPDLNTIITNETMASKMKWTPWHGSVLKGKICAVIVGGESRV